MLHKSFYYYHAIIYIKFLLNILIKFSFTEEYMGLYVSYTKRSYKSIVCFIIK